jgi:hypothetical protein
MKTNSDLLNDVGDALEDIRGMTLLSIRTAESFEKKIRPRDPEAYESLSFAMHDILSRIDKLREELGDDQPEAVHKASEPPASAAPAAEPVSGATDKRLCSAYADLEGAICDATHMVDIATEMANDEEDIDEQLLFAVIHSQDLMRGLKARFYENWGRARADGI